jgi:hypothetical protein
MKKHIVSVILFLFVSFRLFAQLGVNNPSPDPSAVLDVKSNSKGLLIPRMTTAERNAINTPANGLQIFNITTNCLEIFANSLWQSIGCACTSKPKISPIALQTIANSSQITWIWNLVSGATGYKYNTINDYNIAIDNGASQVFDQTGLTCGPQFRNLYVWAYNACGSTGPTTLVSSLKFPVNIAFAGTGAGIVQSAGNEINCSTNCGAEIGCASTITLTATPNANSIFAGWSGGGCTGTGQCVTTIAAATNITANFEILYTLNVLKASIGGAGTATGTVTSNPIGINCGATCSKSYANNTLVTLTAVPSGIASFIGWSGGGCTGTGNCIVTMNASKTVTASFTIL